MRWSIRNTDLAINHQKIAASPYVTQDCMEIGHWHSGFRCRVSGVSSKKARAGLKPMLREGFTTPDNTQKKDLFF